MLLHQSLFWFCLYKQTNFVQKLLIQLKFTDLIFQCREILSQLDMSSAVLLYSLK